LRFIKLLDNFDMFRNCDFDLQDHKYNCKFFVWVDEAETWGLLNGTLDQDV